MIRTQIQLPESDYDELREIAAREDRSLADCIREGIRMFLRRSRVRDCAIDEVAGKFRPEDASDLKPHDRAWVEAIVDSKNDDSPESETPE